MTLQSKVSWLILLAILFYSALDIAAQRLLILPSFHALEQEEALKNMDRAKQAINREIQNLDSSTMDWAFWNDMYLYAQDQNLAFRETNLNELTLDSLKLNLLIIFDADQQFLWGMLFDMENQKEITAPDIVERMKAIRLTELTSNANGVLLTSLGPMLISARPILTSDRQGPVMGTLVLGRFLNTVSISNEARIDLNAVVLDPQNMSPETSSIISKMGTAGENYIRKDGDLNRVYQIMPDLNNKPALLLNVNVPRTISARGETSVAFATFSLLGAGLLILVVLIISLRRMVLIPLQQLTDHAVLTGQNDQLYKPLALKRSDEIGILGQEFDRMVERLATARKSLMEQSYQSGMAEVATAVLHNIGNILNSVNISCTLIMDQLRETRVGNVSKLADMVAEPEGGLSRFLTEDPRGQQIPAYLASLAAVLKEEQQVILKETTSLQSHIEQIKEIVDMQQRYSRVTNASETISAEQLMEDALKMNADDLTRYKITVQHEYQPVQPITVDKQKVLQILLNLISNAKHACVDGQNKEKIITIRIFSLDPDRLSIQVSDNGVGIPAENLPRVFQYGFTTRKSGHGYGLHDGALAAHELGGSLTAHSDGAGLGATFTSNCPIIPETDMNLDERQVSHRILVIDDNAAIHQDFRKILLKSEPQVDIVQEMEFNLFGSATQTRAPTFEIDCVSQGKEGFEIAQQAQSEGHPYALVFVDGRMPPGWDGIETINHLWQVSPDIQVVLCTAYTDYSWQEIQRLLGKSDGLLILKKPFDNIEVLQLAHTLTRKWAMNQDIQTRLNRLAFYDELTGLPNRTLFLDRFTQTINLASRYQHQAALLFMDLDNFKRINDTLGHSFGDDLLKITAERISQCLRTSDTFARSVPGEIAARMGGDEFTVILPELDRELDAAVVAQRIAKQLDQPIRLGSHRVNVSSCIGISIFPQDGNTVETLLKNADIAMYHAKRNGPGSFNFYQESMNANALKHLTIDNHLRQALDRGEFALNYQPQINLVSGQVVGMEALLRWHNRELGNVPPADFIPLAEENGLILPIGEWVMGTACKQAKDWLDQGLPLQRIAVNVSIKQITQPNFLETVAKALRESALEPQWLEIEITENLFMEDKQKTAGILRKLAEMNVQIAIDDFGLGFSSLSHLKDFPIDRLKIDDYFVSGIDRDPKNQSIIGAIIAMAENMNLKVIAEGVETAQQAEFLRGKQCPEAQGYLFSQPLSASKAEDFLRQAHQITLLAKDS